MGTVLLVNTTDLATYSILGGEIDTDKQLSAIRNAQRSWLKPILGKELYNKVMADFRDETLTGIYKELFDDYIFDALVHQAASLYLAHGAFSITNAGITKATPEGTTPITETENDKLVQHERNLAKEAFSQLEVFLKDNMDVLPEYSNSCCKTGKNHFGWYMPDSPLRTRDY